MKTHVLAPKSKTEKGEVSLLTLKAKGDRTSKNATK